MIPAKKDEVLEKLNKFLYEIVDNDSYNPMAFVYKQINKFAGLHYKIAINNKASEELKTFLLMHEAGHIIYRHVSTRNTLNYDFVELKIKAIFEKLKQYFPDGSDEKTIYKCFETHIFNLICDWEINTTFFTKEEVEYWDTLYPKECGDNIHHPLPEEYGFPRGLSANEYLMLILKDPEKFFQNDTNSGNPDDGDQQGQEQGNGNPSDGNGNGEGNGETNGSGNKPTKEEIQKYIESLSQEQAQEEAVENKRIKAQSEENLKGYSKDGEETVELVSDTDDWSDYKELEDKIYNLLYDKTINLSKRDLLYYYNRNRFGSSVCIPKYRSIQSREEIPMTVLLDVSGSINHSDIMGFIEIFKNISSKLDKKCRIVLWNTKLVSEFYTNEEIVVKSGGGTRIGSGIEYINKTTNGDNILFVVSDCEDTLEEWMNIYKKKKYLVCWTSEDEINNNLMNENIEPFKREWEKILIKNYK